MAADLIAVVATAGRPELLQRTLTSLAACQRPEIFCGTVVVENGPKTGAEQIVRLYDSSLRVQYVYKPRANKSVALNKALEGVGNCLIFFTDDDVRIHPDTLCAYAEAAAGRNSGELYGGPLSVDYEREPPEWLKSYLPRSARGWSLGAELRSHEKPEFVGVNWAAFASDLRKAGGFDPNFGTGAATGATGSETTTQIRVLRRGINGIYVPKAKVWHYVPAERCSPKWALRRAYRNGVKEGMNYTEPVPTLLGFPRWMVRKWLGSVLRTLSKSLHADVQTRFQAYYEFCRYCGYVRGGQIAHKQLQLM